MKNQIKIFAILVMLIASMFAAIAPVAAEDSLPLDVIQVKVNGEDVTEYDNGQDVRVQLFRGDDLEITVKLESEFNVSVEDVEVTAFISGDDHYEISDTTDTFDVESGVVYTKKLSLDLPEIMDQDNYNLRILVSSRYGEMKSYHYNLKIDTEKHDVIVKDVVFNPNDEVQDGRSLLSIVRLRNMGEYNEEDVKVTVSIPELGIKGYDYVDEIEAGDSVSTEEIYMRVPSCAAEGNYDVEVEVEYDEGFATVTEYYTITVVNAEGVCGMDENTGNTDAPAIYVVAESVSKETARGEGGAIYPITLSNNGASTKAFTIMVDGVDNWGEARVSPANLVTLAAGETQTVYVYVAANEDATLGEHMFAVSIGSNGKTLEQLTFKTDVVEAQASSNAAKVALGIALAILVVILVVLAIVIGVNKKKESNEDDSEMTQTYY